MYRIEIFDSLQIPLDWFIIYFCIENNFFNPKVVDEYLTQKINNGSILSDDEKNLLLLDDFNKESVLKELDNLSDLSKNFDENMLIAKEKTKFAIVSYLRKHENNLPVLFEKIDNLYADLGYPEDMESFVSYMPVDESVSKQFTTQNDFELNMLNNIDTFLVSKSNKYANK